MSELFNYNNTYSFLVNHENLIRNVLNRLTPDNPDSKRLSRLIEIHRRYVELVKTSNKARVLSLIKVIKERLPNAYCSNFAYYGDTLICGTHYRHIIFDIEQGMKMKYANSLENEPSEVEISSYDEMNIPWANLLINNGFDFAESNIEFPDK